MEVALSEFRRWDELIPDTLGQIFTKLSLQERLTVIPRVCKSWAKAVTGPYCWQEIDIEEWSRLFEPQQVERMVEKLITRSSGSLHKLCVSGLKNETIFNFIAENAGTIQTLRLPRCNLSDKVAENLAGRLSSICILDLSYCTTIGAHALEIIGNKCRQLEVFRRSMHPLDTSGKPFEDVEAFAIASTMPKLKHLEMAYHLISNAGVRQILSLCPKLEYFDMRGCWGVKLENMFVQQDFPMLRVMGPEVLGYYDEMDEFSDASDMDEYYSDDESDESYDESDESFDESSVYEFEFSEFEFRVSGTNWS